MGNVTQEAPTRGLAVMSPGCPMAGPGKLRDGALELVQATLYLQAVSAEQICRQEPPPALPDKGICSQDGELLFLHYF